jgi:transcriptional regulator with AAA-type ATPase domain
MTIDDSTLSANPDGFSRRQKRPAEPHLFRVLECERLLAPPSRHRLNVDEVMIGRGASRIEREQADGKQQLLLRIADQRISSIHARLNVHAAFVSIEDAESKNGVLVNGRREQSLRLGDGDLIQLGGTFFLFRLIEPDVGDDDFFAEGAPAEGLATLLPALRQEFTALADIARSAVPVLIHGESGTGKELVARAIHVISNRRGPLVPINCGALPSTLIESELFGFRKGSFSGATEDRLGAIRESHSGTLFLDELGDLPLAAQPALLRALQQRQVSPIGTSRPVDVDLRVVAATHCDLNSLVKTGRFRADLMARINGFRLTLPALRARREDVGLILATILRRMRSAAAPVDIRLDPDAARQLFTYDWPLNMRELEQSLSAAIVIGKGHINADTLRLAEDAKPMKPPSPVTGGSRLSPIQEDLRMQLQTLLEANNGNISAVARAMNKDRTQIRRWIKAFGMTPK